MSIGMTQEEREAFLAEVRVGVIGIDRPGKGPLGADLHAWATGVRPDDVRAHEPVDQGGMTSPFGALRACEHPAWQVCWA